MQILPLFLFAPANPLISLVPRIIFNLREFKLISVTSFSGPLKSIFNLWIALAGFLRGFVLTGNNSCYG